MKNAAYAFWQTLQRAEFSSLKVKVLSYSHISIFFYSLWNHNPPLSSLSGEKSWIKNEPRSMSTLKAIGLADISNITMLQSPPCILMGLEKRSIHVKPEYKGNQGGTL